MTKTTRKNRKYDVISVEPKWWRTWNYSKYSSFSPLNKTQSQEKSKMLFDGINSLLFHPLNIVHVQFAFPFVECHRIKECHVKACDKSGYPVQGVDGPLLDSYRGSRNPKDNSVGTWNVDGEILRQHSLSLK